MLRKLLNYEWRATSRTLLPLYGGVILLSLINRLLWSPFMNYSGSGAQGVGEPGWVQGIAMTVYVSLIVASFVITFVVLIQRFYKSLLGDEGYLMFTLPVSVSQHIWAKTILACVMSVLSGAAAFASIFVLSGSVDMWSAFFGEIPDLVRALFSNANFPLYALEMLLLMVISMFSGILVLYVCIAIGHLAKRHRVALAVVAYFVLTTALQFLVAMFFMLTTSTGLDTVLMNLPPYVAGHMVLLGMSFALALLGALCFAATHYILSHRLNLE